MSTAAGSPRSPPTPSAGSWPTSNSDTAAAPAARTESGWPRTPGWATSRYTASRRTKSGAPSSCTPSNSRLDATPRPGTTRPAAGNPNGCATGYSACLPPSPAPAAVCCCTSPNGRRGLGWSPTRSPGCALSPSPAERHTHRPDDLKAAAGPWNPHHPRRPRANGHTHTAKSKPGTGCTARTMINNRTVQDPG